MGYNDFVVFDKISNLMINDLKMFELGMRDGIFGGCYGRSVILKINTGEVTGNPSSSNR